MKLYYNLILMMVLMFSCSTIPSDSKIKKDLVLEKEGTSILIISMDQQRKIPPSNIRLILKNVNSPVVFYTIPFKEDHIEYSIQLNPGIYEIIEIIYSNYQVNSDWIVGKGIVEKQTVHHAFQNPIKFIIEKEETKNIGIFTIEYHGTDSPLVKYKSFLMGENHALY